MEYLELMLLKSLSKSYLMKIKIKMLKFIKTVYDLKKCYYILYLKKIIRRWL